MKEDLKFLYIHIMFVLLTHACTRVLPQANFAQRTFKMAFIVTSNVTSHRPWMKILMTALDISVKIVLISLLMDNFRSSVDA